MEYELSEIKCTVKKYKCFCSYEEKKRDENDANQNEILTQQRGMQTL